MAKKVDLSGLSDRQKKDVQRLIDAGRMDDAAKRADTLRGRGVSGGGTGTRNNITPQNPIPDTQKIDTPVQAINLQTAENEAAFNKNVLANQPNQATDFGQRSYTTDPATGRTTVSDQATGQNKAALEGAQGLNVMGLGGAQNIVNPQNSYINPFSLSQVTTPQFAPQGYDAERKRLEEATYQKLTQHLGEQEKQARQDFDQQMQNRGIPLGSDAYNKQKNQLDRSFNDARLSAQLAATQQGGQELQQAYNINTGLRNQQIGELQGQSSFNLGLAGGLSGLGMGYQAPSFVGFNPVQYNAPDVSGTYLGYGQLGVSQGQNTIANRSLQETIRANKANEALSKQRLALAGKQSSADTTPSYGGGLPPGYVM